MPQTTEKEYKEMRQHGSQRFRPQPTFNNERSVNQSILELASNSDQLVGATSNKYSDPDENITEVRTTSNDTVIGVAYEYLHCLEGRRTRYFL